MTTYKEFCEHCEREFAATQARIDAEVQAELASRKYEPPASYDTDLVAWSSQWASLLRKLGLLANDNH